MPNSFIKGINKRGLLIYDGRASSDFGMVVTDAPAFNQPVRKGTAYTVPGRNGVILQQQDAFEDVSATYDVALNIFDGYDEDINETVNAFNAWLMSKKGYLRLEDSFNPNYYRLAYYNGGVSIENSFMMFGKAKLSFMCRAEKYLKSAETPVDALNGMIIYNPTAYTAKPLIRIEGAGNGSLTINGKTLDVKGLGDYIIVDTETMNASREPSENMNNHIEGDFPLLASGSNAIAFTGGIIRVLITPRYYVI